MSTSTRIRALKSKVLWCLKEIPETRNSDIALTLAIWKKFYSEFLKYDKYDRLWVQVKNLYDLPREDNIKRLRAKIQNPKPFLRTGRLSDLPYYLPTNEVVRRKRQINEAVWKAYISCNQLF